MKKSKIEKLRAILCEVFSSNEIPIDIEPLKMGDIDSWDSLGNFNLLLAIEEHYEVRFSMDDIANIKSVSQIIDVLKLEDD